MIIFLRKNTNSLICLPERISPIVKRKITFGRIKTWFKGLFVKDTRLPHEKIKRRKLDTDTIRARIHGVGWKLMELPVKSKDPKTEEVFISRWKLVAVKGEYSMESGGKTIEEAMKNIGMVLGVVPNE